MRLFHQYRQGLVELGIAVAIMIAREQGSVCSTQVLEVLERDGRLPEELDRRFVGACFDEDFFVWSGDEVKTQNKKRNHHAGRTTKVWVLKHRGGT